MKFKFFSITLIAVPFLFLVACSDDDSEEVTEEEALENLNEEGFPIVDDKITIEFMTRKPPTTANEYNDVLFWENYEEKSNIHIDWGLVPTEGFSEKANLSLSGGDYPEAFYISKFGDKDVNKYGEDGVFIEMNDLIDDYMPNLKAWMDEYPEIEGALKNADGKIYSVPTIYSPEFTSLIGNIKPFINKEWLDELDMDMPETTDDFYEFLKAAKEADLNEDGRSIPYGGSDIGGLFSYLKGSFGIGNIGRNHKLFDLDPDNEDELRFYPTSEGYKELLEYVHKLYDEGLIDENIFTIETNEFHELGADESYGSTVTTSPKTRFDSDSYEGMPQLEGPNGDKDWVYLTNPVPHSDAFVITDKNQNPAATARWIDYFYGEEGATDFFMGEEGVTYEETDDGELEYMDEIENDPDGKTKEQALKPYITWLGGGYPAVVEQKYFDGAEAEEESLKAAERLEPDIIDEIMPKFPFTIEENKKLAALEEDINSYMTEMRDKFIAGEEPFSNWDNYVEQIESMGLDELKEIHQKGYERYKDNIGE